MHAVSNTEVLLLDYRTQLSISKNRIGLEAFWSAAFAIPYTILPQIYAIAVQGGTLSEQRTFVQS